MAIKLAALRIDSTQLLRSTQLLISVPLSLAAILVTGCASPPVAPEGIAQLHVDFVNDVLNNNPSELEQRILADFQVTDAELHEAREAFAQCLAEHGVSVEFQPDGGFTAGGDLSMGQGAVDQALDTCERGTTLNISFLYQDMRNNPEGVTVLDLWRACFAEHNLPYGSGMTDAQLSEYVWGGSFDPSEPQAALCVFDPTGEIGLTPQDAMDNLARLHSGEGFITIE